MIMIMIVVSRIFMSSIPGRQMASIIFDDLYIAVLTEGAYSSNNRSTDLRDSLLISRRGSDNSARLRRDLIRWLQITVEKVAIEVAGVEWLRTCTPDERCVARSSSRI